jgi:DNA-binding NarL/FixJ family response regulator
MSAQLCVKLFTELTEISEDVKFFEADRWTEDTEKKILLKLQDLLSVVRHCGKSFEVKINMNVKNFDEALFLIKRKINHQPEINHQKLSIREIEVLDLIMQGYTNNEIGEKLFICYETVKSHRKNILLKTGTKNTAALITHYHQTFFEK